ncbi:MAG: radical SAM protein [Bacteroidales bacterium]|jgi:wyosine [tRNA(Phe)-imidazoG37] synthetase (radical SAM superfamily)|nr:radical SAM protein [Bacteroidales bacterium]
MTFLHNNIIIGVVKSRRLGNSFGINILPEFQKICNFNCIYCECGDNFQHFEVSTKDKLSFPSIEEISKQTEIALLNLKIKLIKIDSITFSGNGEPTLHPNFSEIIDEIIRLRNEYYPDTKISVLTNATMLFDEKIILALKKIENPILKVDAVYQQIFFEINCSFENLKLLSFYKYNLNIDFILDNIKKNFEHPIIQTMFLKTDKNLSLGFFIDNTSDEHIEKYIETMQNLSPKLIMIYSIDRDTAVKKLKKIELPKLQEIGNKLNKVGIETMITG